MRQPTTLAAIALFMTFSVVSKANDRKALVIGNDNYTHTHALLNARNDAKDVADALTSFGYSVNLSLDSTRQQLDQAIMLFTQNLAPGDVALVYYSGHGFQVGGENYLVPVDFAANTASLGRQEGVSISSVLQGISSRGTRVQIIILDACRDNPFFSSRSADAGWADMGNAAGTLMAFGTAPGSTSSDNPTGRNGLFTKALLEHISSTLPIEAVLKQARKETILASQGAQIPWIASSLVGSFRINGHNENQATRSEELSLNDQLALIPTGPSQARDLSGSPVSTNAQSQNGFDLRSADILAQQGILLAQQGNYQEAIRSLSAALEAHPGYSIVLRVLGLIFHVLGRGADAAAQFTRAINTDPEDSLAYTYRCAETTNSDPLSAIRDCYASVAITPQFVPARLLLANALLAQGQSEAALREITSALIIAPDSAQSYAVRARIMKALGQDAAADKDIRRAIALSLPGRP
jgi:uncharacterized caspase-like protein